MLTKKEIGELVKKSPILEDIINLKPVSWLNPNNKEVTAAPDFSITKEDMLAAAQLWKRFAPFFTKAFPEHTIKDGMLESPLKEIPNLKQEMEKEATCINGRFFLKCDNALPIAGSIKARGGFYEVLYHAEQLALKEGLITPEDDYAKFASKEFKNFSVTIK